MNKINNLIETTKIYLRKYDYDNAIKCCDKILEIDPESYFGLRYKGISYYQQENYECGLKYYEKLHNLLPYDKDVNYSIAFLNQQLGNYETAINYYEKSDKCDETKNIIKRLLSKIKHYDTIISEYDKELESLNKHNLNTEIIKHKIVLLEEKAVYHYRNQEYPKSIKSFTTACQLYNEIKNDITYHKDEFDKWYGRLEDCLAKYDEKKFFIEFFDIGKKFEIWSDKIGFRLSQFEDSLVFTDILLELYPENVKLLEISANSANYINVDYSKNCWKKILTIEPENTTAIYKMLDIYSHEFSKDKQLQLIDSKLYIEDIKIDLYVRKIRLLESMTLYDEALKTYDEYLNIKKPEGTINHPLTVFDKIRCMEQYALELYLEDKIDESYNILKDVSRIFNETEKNTCIISSEEWRIEKWYNDVLEKSINNSHDESKKFFDEFYNLNEETIELWIDKIKILIDWKKFGNPITYCNIFLSKYPKNICILETKAFIYYRTSRLEKSLDNYNKLLIIDPENSKAKNYKFNILVQYHEYIKSYKLLKTMKIEYNVISYYLRQLIDALIHYRKYEEAKYCLEIVLQNNFNIQSVNKLKVIWNKTHDEVHQKESPYYLDWINLINYMHEEYVCPKCGGKLIPIIYGLIHFDKETEEKLGKEFVLGGCCVSDDSPTDYCNQCQEEIHMGTYGINISNEDYDLYMYAHENILWLTQYLENYPEKTQKQVKRAAYKDLSLDDTEFMNFIDKLEKINFIVKDNNHLRLNEVYKQFHNAI